MKSSLTGHGEGFEGSSESLASLADPGVSTSNKVGVSSSRQGAWRSPSRRSDGLGATSASTTVIRRIARSMLGRAVSIHLSTGETVHGIVTDVYSDGVKPRVVVGAEEYLVTQVLTVAPPDLASNGI